MPLRVDRSGSLFPAHVAPTRHQFAEEGSYLVGFSAGPFLQIGQGAVWPLRTAFDVAAPCLIVANTAPTPASPSAPATSIAVDYLKLLATAATAGATSINYAIRADFAPVDAQGYVGPPDGFARIISNDTRMPVVLTCPRADAAGPTMVAAWSQQVNPFTLQPSASAYTLARGTLGGAVLAGHELLIACGSTDVGSCTYGTETQPGRRVSSAPPIMIGPGYAMYFYLWTPGAGASMNPEFELGLWGR